ncbi:MAG TPA: DoxX family protein [Desulfuromonadales bacterium]|jgi:putative oxidoreductase|nr:DoxX family protein [Desulfuromonadales bacterium]
MALKFLGKYREFGLLLLRLGIGAMFLYHGWPKLVGGPEKWEKVGLAMQFAGVHAVPTAWGLAAALSEFAGGLCLILGLFFRPACLLLTITMAVAANMHLGKGEGILAASHAIELGILFFSLLFIGPGRYSVDKG